MALEQLGISMMRPYNTNTNEHRAIMLVLGGLSIGLAWVVQLTVRYIPMEIPWWLEIPSIAPIFGFIYFMFDKWVWKLPLLHAVGVVKAPNLQGRWKGYLRSSHDNQSKKHSVDMTIQQTWTRMLVTLETKTSRSHSVAASVNIEDGKPAEIWFNYRNEPKGEAPTALNIHYGTAILNSITTSTIGGQYFTGRGRANFGIIHLERCIEEK